MMKNKGMAGLLRLVKYAKPYQWSFIAAFLLLLSATAIEMTAPWLMKIILDDYIAPGKNDIMQLAMLGSLLFASYAGSAVLQYVQNV